jgi:predicted kinase
LLLIVNGRPATGKTQLARLLARELGLPLIHKDGVKEPLYDTLGAPDRFASRRLGLAALAVQRAIAAELLATGVSLILEANYREEFEGDPMRSLIAAQHATVGQIWLSAQPDVLIARFTQRAGDAQRHPGHRELAYMDEMRQTLAAPDDTPLSLPGPLLALDTTIFRERDTQAALAFARLLMSGAEAA